ncbi:MAG: hypothetical protein LBP76_02940, partial [Treponema sp.]|nr:hypothetical protein [Treponema sp.]
MNSRIDAFYIISFCFILFANQSYAWETGGLTDPEQQEEAHNLPDQLNRRQDKEKRYFLPAIGENLLS